MGLVDELGGSEGTGGELNPLAINHTPMNSSHRPTWNGLEGTQSFALYRSGKVAWLWFCMVCLLMVRECRFCSSRCVA